MNELDLTELEVDLYKAWQRINKRNYGGAENKIAAAWAAVHQFRINEDLSHLKGTRDAGGKARLVRLVYSVLNLFIDCGEYHCEWVYPYGFVPEAGCLRHD